ncbi:FAD-binding oxidoreductase [Acrocarpospora catenulata]|uniref:FAD-binding oxidoreductase n=1 Tax=Acrocarpospora catenulata TaxID=2836182 RepID=UPI001BDB4F91|nr:FAD-binding oxidoreductase [Acrocarpospora catenulata]
MNEISGFNLSVVHRPALVAVAETVEDVVEAIRYAAARDLPVAVQATGHGAVQAADGAVLVLTSRLREISVDPATRTATIGAGVTWGEVVRATAPHGLAPLTGSASGVGAVGFTLGGGIGPLARTFGFAADHVRSLTVVTPDARVRFVDAGSEPDLFWALRGGKGGFGVVTSMTVDLFPLTSVHGGGYYFAASDAAAVLRAYREWAPGLPESVTTSVALLRLPPLPQLPPPLRGQFVAHLRVASAEPLGSVLDPMLAVASPVLGGVGPLPYTHLDTIHNDPTDPMPVTERSTLLHDLTADGVEALLAAAGPQIELPVPVVEVRHLGGALGREPKEPNAVGGRDGAYSLLVIGLPGSAPEAVVGALAPWSTGGALINFQGSDLAPEALGRAWPEATRLRLGELRERFDPRDLFRIGHVAPRL